MKHDAFLINSNGKAEKKDSWLYQKFSLSALGNLISKRNLVKRVFLMSQQEYEDILKWSKEED